MYNEKRCIVSMRVAAVQSWCVDLMRNHYRRTQCSAVHWGHVNVVLTLATVSGFDLPDTLPQYTRCFRRQVFQVTQTQTQLTRLITNIIKWTAQNSLIFSHASLDLCWNYTVRWQTKTTVISMANRTNVSISRTKPEPDEEMRKSTAGARWVGIDDVTCNTWVIIAQCEDRLTR